MLQLCLSRPPPAEAGGSHAAVISAGELDRLGLLLRGPAEANVGGAASEQDGSPMDVSPTPFQGARLRSPVCHVHVKWWCCSSLVPHVALRLRHHLPTLRAGL